MIKNKVFIFFIVSLISFIAGAQDQRKSKGDGGIGYTGLDYILGYQYQKHHTLEFGIAYGTRGEELASLFYGNIHLCGEVLANGNRNIYALKSGISATFIFLTVAGQFIYFSDFNKSSFAFRPEIGLSLFGFIDLNVGRNIVFTKDDPLNVNSTAFILRFTIGKSSRKMF